MVIGPHVVSCRARVRVVFPREGRHGFPDRCACVSGLGTGDTDASCVLGMTVSGAEAGREVGRFEGTCREEGAAMLKLGKPSAAGELGVSTHLKNVRDGVCDLCPRAGRFTCQALEFSSIR